MTQKTVSEFALQSESDLRTALAVADAVPEIKRQVVREFLQKLKGKLEAELGRGWRFDEKIADFFEEPYGRFSMWKESWDGKFYIALEGQNHLRNGVVWGVRRDRDKLKGEPNSEILKRFQKEKYDGKSNRWWECYVYPKEHELRYWNEAEAIIKLHFQLGEAVEYFKTRMLKAAEIAEPLLDKMCKV
jgi:hypothetical protein